MADLTFDTPAKNDQMAQAIKDKIVGKLIWGKANITQGLNENGQPNNVVEIRFEKEADADDLYNLIVDRMTRIPVLKGTVTAHPCTHDEEHPESCVITKKYVKE